MLKKNEKPNRTFAGLVKAIDWYDVSLQAILEDLNLESVNRTQSMMLSHIARGVTRPCEIAREMGTTRQNIHAVGKNLISKNILKQLPDPRDRRSKIYSFSDDGLVLRNKVLVILTYLDKKLSDKVGKDKVKALEAALEEDWGDYVLAAPRELKSWKMVYLVKELD